MKLIVFTSLCLLTLIHGKPAEQYTDKFDSIDVKEIITNKRLFLPYVKCILDHGKCSPEGKELKSHIKEALETYCAKCTAAQRRETQTVISHLVNKEAEIWKQVTAKYDPDKKYVKKYETELKSIAA